MTKSVASQYFSVLAESKKCKPRSARKTIMTKKASDLLHRQMRIELRQPLVTKQIKVEDREDRQ